MPKTKGFGFGSDFVAELIGKAGKDGTYDFDLTNIISSYLKTFMDYVVGGTVWTALHKNMKAALNVLTKTPTPLQRVRGLSSDRKTFGERLNETVTSEVEKYSKSKDDVEEVTA